MLSLLPCFSLKVLYKDSFHITFFIHMSAGVKISFLTKFKIMKLKIETFSIFMIFLKCSTKEPRIDPFVEQSAISHYSTSAYQGIWAGELSLNYGISSKTQERKTKQGKISGFSS